KLYVFFFVFILLINILAYVGRIADESDESKRSSEKTLLVQEEGDSSKDEKAEIVEEDTKVREEKLLKLAQEKPLLYFALVVINLIILFLVFIGILLDGYFLKRWLRREPMNIRLVSADPPAWTIGDVLRVALIFMFCGYTFVIVQSFLVGVFPIINNENFRMVVNTAMMNVVGISVIFYFIIKKYGQKIDTIGISANHPVKGMFHAVVGYIALVPILICSIAAVVLTAKLFHYKPPVQPIVHLFMEEKATSILWFSTLFAAIGGPIAEEIFFRGFMYPAVKKKIGIPAAMLVTSAIFAFLHAHLVGFLPIMLLGLLLVYLFEKTGSLIPSVCVHITHNIGMIILVFIVRMVGS
ncbi:MAG: type II CAAX endopeptidase family protein, partial [Candidatus Omnitrophica bacterium]|nr:type II CAAX endopeptidase family protein [Candidatus Omnitrophota bacterium]